MNSGGKLKWKLATGGQVHGAPAVAAKGVIYFGSDDHYLYAVNLYAVNHDGTLRWKFPTGDSVDSGPAIGADGAIYVGSWDGFLYAVTPDGKLRWKFDTGNEVVASPAIGADGAIYIGSKSWNGKLYAVNHNGTLRWAFPIDGPVLNSPAIGAGGTVYVTTHNDVYGGRTQYGVMYAVGSGGHSATSTAIPEASGQEQASIARSGDLSAIRNWRLYHNAALGLSFSYPPSMKVTEQIVDPTDKPNPLAFFPHLSAKVILDSTDGEKGLLAFYLSDHLTTDETVSDERSLRGCGYATPMLIGGQKAFACAYCSGGPNKCNWKVYLYETGRECQIDLGTPVPGNSYGPIEPIQDGAYSDWGDTRSDFLPLLSIIRTVRCDPRQGKESRR